MTFEANAPAVIAAAALGPALCFALLIARLDRRSPRPWLALLVAFLWGGTVAAAGAQMVNDLALRSLPPQQVSNWVAPLVEEAFKGSALAVVLLVRADAWRSVREGILCALLAGIGFAATENLGYYVVAAVQGGSVGLARAVYLRGVIEGLNHGLFAALFGAGLGYARSRCVSRRTALAVGTSGFILAVALHALWNASLSPRISAILCNAGEAGGACAVAPAPADLLFVAPALVALFVGPAALLLALLARKSPRSSF